MLTLQQKPTDLTVITKTPSHVPSLAGLLFMTRSKLCLRDMDGNYCGYYRPFHWTFRSLLEQIEKSSTLLLRD